MAIYLPILTAILAGVGFLGGLQTVGIALAVVTVVLMIALKHGHRVSQAVHSENSEVFLLNVLGLALLVAVEALLLCASPTSSGSPGTTRVSHVCRPTSVPMAPRRRAISQACGIRRATASGRVARAIPRR